MQRLDQPFVQLKDVSLQEGKFFLQEDEKFEVDGLHLVVIDNTAVESNQARREIRPNQVGIFRQLGKTHDIDERISQSLYFNTIQKLVIAIVGEEQFE